MKYRVRQSWSMRAAQARKPEGKLRSASSLALWLR